MIHSEGIFSIQEHLTGAHLSGQRITLSSLVYYRGSQSFGSGGSKKVEQFLADHKKHPADHMQT